jgi:hypothetical protein
MWINLVSGPTQTHAWFGFFIYFSRKLVTYMYINLKSWVVQGDASVFTPLSEWVIKVHQWCQYPWPSKQYSDGYHNSAANFWNMHLGKHLATYIFYPVKSRFMKQTHKLKQPINKATLEYKKITGNPSIMKWKQVNPYAFLVVFRQN